MSRSHARRRAFTLVELIVVVGIISLLTGLIMPAITGSWRSARTVKCASNMHQILIAMSTYAAQSNGRYPPNTATPAPGLYWYDDARLGSIIAATRPPVPAGKPGGGAYVCPCDDPGANFSYSMNVWSSATIDASVLVQQQSGFARQWTPHDGPASKLILLVESYSGTGTAAGYYAPPVVGIAVATTPVTTAGQRFGGAGGIAITAGRFRKVTSEVNFMRHRPGGTPGAYTQPRGLTNIGYADGHVACQDRPRPRHSFGPVDRRQLLDPGRLAGALTMATYGPGKPPQAPAPTGVLIVALFTHRAALTAYVDRQLPQVLRATIDPADVVQDVCFEAMRREADFRPVDDASGRRWIFTIARRRIVRLLQRQQLARRSPQADDSLADLLETLAVYQRTPSRSAASHETWRLVQDSIGRLRPEHASVIKSRYLDGLPPAEVAAKTGRTANAVDQLLHRGHDRPAN